MSLARQEKLWPTLRANWALWPLANWIAFRYLGGDMRILYSQIIGVSFSLSLIGVWLHC